MYPIEYRWISALTPVTKSAIVTESGSTRSEAFTCSGPAEIQVNMLIVTSRDAPEGRESRPA